MDLWQGDPAGELWVSSEIACKSMIRKISGEIGKGSAAPANILMCSPWFVFKAFHPTV